MFPFRLLVLKKFLIGAWFQIGLSGDQRSDKKKKCNNLICLYKPRHNHDGIWRSEWDHRGLKHWLYSDRDRGGENGTEVSTCCRPDIEYHNEVVNKDVSLLQKSHLGRVQARPRVRYLGIPGYSRYLPSTCDKRGIGRVGRECSSTR